MKPQAVIVMGVSGSGKTTVGRRLAKRLGWPFHDADDFHPEENVEKMRAGVPLGDAARAPWLERLHDLIAHHLDAGQPLVLACSALKERYRDALRGTYGERVLFVHLAAPFEVIQGRLAGREGHYMPSALLKSQFETLEVPEDALRLNAEEPVEALLERVLAALEQGSP